MPVITVVPNPPTIRFVDRQCSSVTVECIPDPFDGGAPVWEYAVYFYRSDFNTVNSNSVFIQDPSSTYYNVNPRDNTNDLSVWNSRRLTLTGLLTNVQYTAYCKARNRIG
jgi:hypothetical protein